MNEGDRFVVRRQQAALRREALIEEGYRLKGLAEFSGDFGLAWVMHPDTANFLVHDPSNRDNPKPRGGDKVLWLGIPIRYSTGMEPNRLLLTTAGWPFFGVEDQVAMRSEWGEEGF